jgi:hypothetical protein
MLEDAQPMLLAQYNSFLKQSKEDHPDGNFRPNGPPPFWQPPQAPITGASAATSQVNTPSAILPTSNDVDVLRAQLLGV